ncbi:MAG: DUF4373 domain-containing protein [Dorea sp.]|nr:DUF4373 domain-containing protein [Dorea sp.]
MARPKQDGLLYFSFDTDFFYADKRIKRLHSRYGNDGIIFYIYLLTEIYRNGYYIRWDAESMDDAMDDLHLTEGFIEQVMTFLVSRSLLVKRTLTNPDTIITIQKEGDNRPQCELADGGNGQERAEVISSPGIQKRYQEAVKGRKRQFEVNAEIWLLDEEETASCIKVANNKSFSEKNPYKSEKNKSKSKKNTAKESKVNKSKGKEIMQVVRFDDFWSVFPNKQRRYLAETAYSELVLSGSVTEDQLILAATNYALHIKDSGDKMFMPNNFLEKCVFEDYLEVKHPEAPKAEETDPNPDPEEELIGEDEEWWKYGPNGWEE